MCRAPPDGTVRKLALAVLFLTPWVAHNRYDSSSSSSASSEKLRRDSLQATASRNAMACLIVVPGSGSATLCAARLLHLWRRTTASSASFLLFADQTLCYPPWGARSNSAAVRAAPAVPVLPCANHNSNSRTISVPFPRLISILPPICAASAATSWRPRPVEFSKFTQSGIPLPLS